MRIGVDVRELLGRPTGVGRYLRHLLAEWARAATSGSFKHRVVLYSPADLPAAVQGQFQGLAPELRIVPGGAGTWWEQVQLPGAAARDQLDVLFAPAYTAPLRATCAVVQTIHDLSFLAHPEWFAARERLRRAWLTRWSARRAALILTDSRFSAVEIHDRLGIPESRIRVVPLGLTAPGVVASDSARQTASPAAAWPPWPAFAGREPGVLYVGSLFNRRRIPELVRAFALVAGRVPGARLDIVGENRTHPFQDLARLCRDLGIADRVTLRDYAADEDLLRLYRSARVFVFLSAYEGFGLTPLEALSCGVPVVMADSPVARETCGEAACYVDPDDVDLVAAQIVRLLCDERAHGEALAPARAVLSRYRWSDAARATLDALEAAASRVS